MTYELYHYMPSIPTRLPSGNAVYALTKKLGLRTATTDTDNILLIASDGHRLSGREDERVWSLYERFERHLESYQENADNDASVQQV